MNHEKGEKIYTEEEVIEKTKELTYDCIKIVFEELEKRIQSSDLGKSSNLDEAEYLRGYKNALNECLRHVKDMRVELDDSFEEENQKTSEKQLKDALLELNKMFEK